MNDDASTPGPVGSPADRVVRRVAEAWRAWRRMRLDNAIPHQQEIELSNNTEALKAALPELMESLRKCHRRYGEVGTRDVDIAEWNAGIDAAIAQAGNVLAALAQTEQPEPCKNCPPGHKCDHYGCMRGRFTAPSQAEQPTVAVQTAWEWAGGNPGIKATAEELKVALQELDKACDEKAEPAEKAQPEPITLADVLDALNVFNKPRPGDGDEPWTEEDFISVKHLPAFLTVCYAAWYAAPPAAPQQAVAPDLSQWAVARGAG